MNHPNLRPLCLTIPLLLFAGVLSRAQPTDAQILEITDPKPGTILQVGEAEPIKATVFTNGTGLVSVPVFFEARDLSGTIVFGPTTVHVNVPGGANEEAIPLEEFIPPQVGTYIVTVFSNLPDDPNRSNDTMRVEVSTEQQSFLSREQAIAILNDQYLDTVSTKDQLIAYFYNIAGADSVLRRGDSVSDLGATFTDAIDAEQYFAFVDHEPQSDWEHPSSFVYIDAATGDLSVMESQSLPVVNDAGPRKSLQNSLPPVSGSQNLPKPDTSSNQNTTVPRPDKNECALIVIGANLSVDADAIAAERKSRLNDVDRIKQYLNANSKGPKLPGNNIKVLAGKDSLGATRAEMRAALAALKNSGKSKFYFFYVGHGSVVAPGGLPMRRDTTGTRVAGERFASLAERLNGIADEVETIIVACSAGFSVREFQKYNQAQANNNEAPLKGTLITATDSVLSSQRKSRGSDFIIGFFDCTAVDDSDLNNDGFISPAEATAWLSIDFDPAATRNPQIEHLSDASGKAVPRITRRTRALASDDISGPERILYEEVSLRYRVIVGNETQERVERGIYVFNPDNVLNFKTDRKIEIVCVGVDGTESVIHVHKPRLRPERGKCLAPFVPDDCVDFFPRFKAPSLPAPSDNIRAAENFFAVYKPGEHVFRQFAIAAPEGTLFRTSVVAPEGWELSADPAEFTMSGLLETHDVFIRGRVPDTATTGGAITLQLVNVNDEDTLQRSYPAYILDERLEVSGPAHFDFAFVEPQGNIATVNGELTFVHSFIHAQAPIAVTAEGANTLTLRNTAVSAEAGASYTARINDNAILDGAIFANPENGLILESPQARVFGSMVVGSTGDGIRLIGDQSGLDLEFVIIDAAAGNGLALTDVRNCTLRRADITNSGASDVVLRQNSDATLVDCLYDDARETIEPGSTLRRVWSTSIAVVDAESKPIAGAIIEIRDAQGALVSRDTTGARGVGAVRELLQYTAAGAERTLHTPHTIDITSPFGDTSLTHMATAEAEFDVQFDVIVGIREHSAGPVRAAAYPNPFHSSTVIAFDLDAPQYVRLDVFTAAGQRITTLIDGQRGPGLQRVDFTPDERRAAGAYYYRLVTGDIVEYGELLLAE